MLRGRPEVGSGEREAPLCPSGISLPPLRGAFGDRERREEGSGAGGEGWGAGEAGIGIALGTRSREQREEQAGDGDHQADGGDDQHGAGVDMPDEAEFEVFEGFAARAVM